MYSLGLKSAKRFDIDPETGLGINGVSVGDVFKDTMDYTRGDATQTNLYSQQQPDSPKITLNKKGIATCKFSVMNTEADQKKAYMGGTVTVVDGKKTWNEPATSPTLNYYYEFVTDDGQLIKIYNGSTSGKENYQFRDQGILLIDVVITPQAPIVADLPATSATDAPTA
jgi:hypothetical protein